MDMRFTLDLLQKSGKGEGERGKGLVFSLSPLTFNLFPQECKKHFCKRSTVKQAAQENPENIVQVTDAGRSRLATSFPFNATVGS